MNWRTRMKLMLLAPWLLFVTTLGLVAWFNGGISFDRPVTAFAEGVPEGVAPLEPGRLSSLAVEPGQDVAEGQVVATLDTATIDAEIAVVEAQRQQAEAQIAAVEAETLRQVHLDGSKLTQWRDEAKVALAREEVALAKAEALERTLRAERDRLQEAVQRRLAPASELARVDVEYESAAREAEELPRLIAALRRQVQGKNDGTRDASSYWKVLAAPLQRELQVVEQQLAWLKRRREAMTLRAPAAGRVTTVLKRPGEVVVAGEAVAMVVRQQTTRVVACVSEQGAVNLAEGTRALLWPAGGGEVVKGVAVALGPLVDELPVRCRTNPKLPAWGRSVVIQLDEAAAMLPGQTFDVRFEADGLAQPPGVATAGLGVTMPLVEQAHAAPTTSPERETALAVEIPEALGRDWHLEPSALLWRPELARYLVVSDDTGREDARKHAPVLFTVTMDGRADPTPVPIHGIDELNDAESLAVAPDGTLYVLASQSKSKNGKRKAARTAFLKLSHGAQGLQVQGQVQLHAQLAALAPDAQQALGLPGGVDSLDIEGMTMWRGALYLGLKSPQDAQGRSLIWKVEHPERLFSGAGVKDAGLSLWGRVQLDADSDGKTVPGGISELLFLPDGTLVVTSTPSTTDNGKPTGRLWTVAEPPGGEMTPRLVRSFAGLKPEGLSLSPHPGRIAVMFDEGSNTPRWMELPWPR